MGVEKAKSFEFSIIPADGFVIADIKIDGADYDKSYDKTGYNLVLDSVTKDTKVTVEFKKALYTVKVYTYAFDGNGTQVDNTLYKTYEVEHGSVFKLDQYGENVTNVFFYKDSQGGLHYINSSLGVTINNDNFEIISTKTAEELDEILNPSNPE